MDNIYYTYIYLDPRKPGKWMTSTATFMYEPFYAGKGNGDRMLYHLRSKGNSYKYNKIKKIIQMGLQPIILQLHTNLCEADALMYESQLIKEIGTIYHIDGVARGPLTNLKLDGVQQIYSAESRQKMSKAATRRIRQPHSEETKQKIREAKKCVSVETRAKISAALKGVKRSPEFREMLSKTHKGRHHTQEQRDKASAALRGRKRPDHLGKLIAERQRKIWRILIQETGEIIDVPNLKQWCVDNSINYNTLCCNRKKDAFHKGYKIVGCSGGNH